MKKILAYTVWLLFWWPQPWLAAAVVGEVQEHGLVTRSG